MEKTDSAQQGTKWIQRISNARMYESIYRQQAYSAYKLYNKNFYAFKAFYSPVTTPTSIDSLIDKFSAKNNRGNIYYANIETLISLVLPSAPNLKLFQKNKLSNFSNSMDAYYSKAVTLLENVLHQFIKKSLTKNTFKRFKLDFFITGRGILWVDQNSSAELPENFNIEYVHWLNFAMDPALEWKNVRWVAKRSFVSKPKLKKMFPQVNFEAFRFTNNPYIDMQGDSAFTEIDTSYLAQGGDYAELWEVWDKQSHQRLIISQQSNEKIIHVDQIENVPDDVFFPCPEPPISVSNGTDMIPCSEVWTYINELKQISFISARKEQLLRSLILKGFASSVNNDVLFKLNAAKDGDIISVNNFDPQYPNVINYLDNKPKVEMLQILSEEHEKLKENIFEVSGISEQMRSISAQGDSQADEQSATEVKTKTIFGSRRLREKQDCLCEYLSSVYKILLFKVASSISENTLKSLIKENLPQDFSSEISELLYSKNNLAQSFAQPQPQPQQGFPQQESPQQNSIMENAVTNGPSGRDFSVHNSDGYSRSNPSGPSAQDAEATYPETQGWVSFPQAQPQPIDNQIPPDQMPDTSQAQSQIDLINNKILELNSTLTWSNFLKFLRTEAISSLDMEIDLDDLNSLMGHSQLAEQSMNNLNILTNNMLQLIQMSVQNPDFADVFESIFETSVSTGIYNTSQKQALSLFVNKLHEKVQSMKNNPQPPQPSPDMIRAQAAMTQAQAQVQRVQQDAQLKSQSLAQDAQLSQAKLQADAQSSQAAFQSKSQQAAFNHEAANFDSKLKIENLNIQKMKLLQDFQLKKQQLAMSMVKNNSTSSPNDYTSEFAAIKMKHEMEMLKLQKQIDAENIRYKDKMAADEKLMRLKIAADDNRNKDKIESDVILQKLKNNSTSQD